MSVLVVKDWLAAVIAKQMHRIVNAFVVIEIRGHLMGIINAKWNIIAAFCFQHLLVQFLLIDRGRVFGC